MRSDLRRLRFISSCRNPSAAPSFPARVSCYRRARRGNMLARIPSTQELKSQLRQEGASRGCHRLDKPRLPAVMKRAVPLVGVIWFPFSFQNGVLFSGPSGHAVHTCGCQPVSVAAPLSVYRCLFMLRPAPCLRWFASTPQILSPCTSH